MKKYILIIIVIIIIIFIIGYKTGYNAGYSLGQGNQYPTYGVTGAPRNCRALISANITGYEIGYYTAIEALSSIKRNCGQSGYIWDER